MKQIPLMGFDIKPMPPQPPNNGGNKGKKRKKKKRSQVPPSQSKRVVAAGRVDVSRLQAKSPQGDKQSGSSSSNRRNAAREHNGRSRARRRKKNYALHYIFLTIVLLITLVVLSFTVFFDIKSIEVTGNAPLDHEEIIKQSGVFVGDNLMFVDKSRIESAIMAKTYLLDKVDVKRRFPSTVEICLDMSDAMLGIKYGGMHYYFSETLRLIDKTDGNTKPGVVVFRGIELTQMELGQYLTATPENNLELCLEILNDINDSNLAEVSYVDMRDDVNVDIFYKDQIQIKVGRVTDMEYKLESAYRVISQKITEGQVGVLDVQTERKAYFRQKDITMP